MYYFPQASRIVSLGPTAAPDTSYFLFGPRGTGKSVFTMTRYPEAFRLGLLEPDIHRGYAARPERLRERLAAEPSVRKVVLDEVQRVLHPAQPLPT